MTTPLDLLPTIIRAASGASAGLASPVADCRRGRRSEWDGLISVVRSHVPRLSVLGSLNSGKHTGPPPEGVVDSTMSLRGHSFGHYME